MNSLPTRRHDACKSIYFHKTPLAACLAAAMAFSVSGPLMAHGNDSASVRSPDHSLLLQGYASGSNFAARLQGPQADRAEAAMQRMLGIQAPSVVTGATIPVSNCNNSGSGSLRAAIGFASSGDTIDMSGLNCSVDLTSSIVTTVDDLTIQGNPDHKYPFINGQNAHRPLVHTGTGTLTLSGVTVENGKVSASSSSRFAAGCVFSAGDVVLSDSAQVKYCTVENTGTGNAIGGGIYSAGYTGVFSGSIVTGGHAKAASGNALGGGIYAKGGAFLKYGEVRSNSAYSATGVFARGGGIYSSQDLGAVISHIGNNIASSGTSTLDTGGGAWIGGSATIIASSIYSNHADSAAALLLGFNGGSSATAIYESTIANNKAVASNAKYGGAVYLGSTSTIENCTISGNTEKNSTDTKYGAGILIDDGVSVSMSSTIVSGNNLLHSTSGALPSNFHGDSTTSATVTGDHNLVGLSKFTTVPGDTIRTDDPKLGPLANNGGLTVTMAVLPGSPAIDVGTANGDTVDQRGTGFKRVVGAGADIGAFELGGDTIFANGFESP